MPLDDFEWQKAVQWFKGEADSFRLQGTEIARMSQRVDNGSWFVTLDRHLGWNAEKQVSCTSYERGRAGVEIWATRHQVRLKREIQEKWSKRPKDRC